MPQCLPHILFLLILLCHGLYCPVAQDSIWRHSSLSKEAQHAFTLLLNFWIFQWGASDLLRGEGREKANSLSAPSSSPVWKFFLDGGTKVESVGVVLLGKGLGSSALSSLFVFLSPVLGPLNWVSLWVWFWWVSLGAHDGPCFQAQWGMVTVWTRKELTGWYLTLLFGYTYFILVCNYMSRSFFSTILKAQWAQWILNIFVVWKKRLF